ncbi:hypothetical protein J3R82DRAFT_4216 [Butyriboletus roseoflavus]|nr:hypothetical protein J3R82DRAFT_4216 [Butyriboletus roseoflavus]
MEYDPRYPQPFSLSQAIALDPAVAWDGLVLEIASSHLLLTVLTEIARLRNSLQHLRRSQNELQEYLRELASEEEDLEVSQAVKENEITMHLRTFRASQDERILMLKLALTHHGHSVASEQASEPTTTGRPQNIIGFNSNGLDDFPPVERPSAVNPEPSEVEEQENGVYL